MGVNWKLFLAPVLHSRVWMLLTLPELISLRRVMSGDVFLNSAVTTLLSDKGAFAMRIKLLRHPKMKRRRD